MDDVDAALAWLPDAMRDGGRVVVVLSDRTRERAVERMRDAACARMEGVHLVPGAGHWVQQERPEEANELLLHFLRLLREHAYARSPFYRRFHKGLEDRPLNELPVLTKATLMEHFDELVTDPTVRLADVEGGL